MSWLEQLNMLGTPGSLFQTYYQLLSVSPMLNKNIAGQKWVVFAFSSASGLPVTGDAANITAVLSKDGASTSALTDVNPVELGGGFYCFDLTQAETNADVLAIICTSATSNVLVFGWPGSCWTRTVELQAQAALTAQGYSVARSAKLDNLDRSITASDGIVIDAMTQPDTL